MTAESELPELSDSTFSMLRCVVAVAAADKMIRSQELLFLNNLLIHYRKQATVTAAQVARLQDDLKHQQPVETLLTRVTARPDREQLVLFAGLMAQSDGELHPSEDEIVQKIKAFCTIAPANDTDIVEPSGTSSQQQLAIPGFDMGAFKKEIRSIVQQEFYRHALSKSGVGAKTGGVAIADAFAEQDPRVSQFNTYDQITQDAGRHRAYVPAEEEPTVPKTQFGARTMLRMLFLPAVLALLAPHANMLFATFTYHQAMALDQWGMSQEAYIRVFHILSNPLWGTLPGRIMRDWAAFLLLWRLYALWMSGRLSPLMKRSILQGERVLGKARFHFFTVHVPLLIAGILWLLSFKINMWLAEQTYHAMDALSEQHMVSGTTYDMAYHFFSDPFWGTLPAQVFRWSAFLIILLQLVRAWTTEIVATDSRLLFRQGIFNIHTLKIDIADLRQIDVQQSMLGLLLDFGSVHVYTKGWQGKGDELEVSGIYLPPVADPHTFSTLVDRAKRMRRKGVT